MCLGIPMKIIETGFGFAICQRGDQKREINTQLVGEQPEGTWLLTFLDAAREVLTEEEAKKIDNAVKALELALDGQTDFDHLFADLIEREPQLPAHLQPEKQTETKG